MEKFKNEKLNNLYLALKDLYGDCVGWQDIGENNECISLDFKLTNNNGNNPKSIYETVWFSVEEKEPSSYATLIQPNELKKELNSGYSVWVHECDEDFY